MAKYNNRLIISEIQFEKYEENWDLFKRGIPDKNTKIKLKWNIWELLYEIN